MTSAASDEVKLGALLVSHASVCLTSQSVPTLISHVSAWSNPVTYLTRAKERLVHMLSTILLPHQE